MPCARAYILPHRPVQCEEAKTMVTAILRQLAAAAASILNFLLRFYFHLFIFAWILPVSPHLEAVECHVPIILFFYLHSKGMRRTANWNTLPVYSWGNNNKIVKNVSTISDRECLGNATTQYVRCTRCMPGKWTFCETEALTKMDFSFWLYSGRKSSHKCLSQFYNKIDQTSIVESPAVGPSPRPRTRPRPWTWLPFLSSAWCPQSMRIVYLEPCLSLPLSCSLSLSRLPCPICDVSIYFEHSVG